MKQLKTTLILLLIISAFAACKKDTFVPIHGNWFGKSKLNDSPNELTATFLIKEDNTLKADIGENLIGGKWSLDGVNFTAILDDGSIYTAIDNKKGKLTNGTWIYQDVNITLKGTWSMEKGTPQLN